MGKDPAVSVVDPGLQVHDTPGLYVFGGAVFPACHEVNPTLTMWALCLRAAEQLVERLTWGGSVVAEAPGGDRGGLGQLDVGEQDSQLLVLPL